MMDVTRRDVQKLFYTKADYSRPIAELEVQDMDYICCSNYGRARSKGFHCRYYKQFLAENGLPDIRWHDLRIIYCTLLLKEAFNPKAVSKLMGHAKEFITMDVFVDGGGMAACGTEKTENISIPENKEPAANVETFEYFISLPAFL